MIKFFKKELISRKNYDNRNLPTLNFTRDYTVNDSILYLQGDEYPPYMYNYDRMIELLHEDIIRYCEK